MKCNGASPMTDEEIRSALDNAVGASNIVEQARGKGGKIVIACDGLSRPTPAGRVIPFIIEALHEAGVSNSRIFVLGSFGCHHPMNLDDFARKLGEEVVAQHDCVNHNPFYSFRARVPLGRRSASSPFGGSRVGYRVRPRRVRFYVDDGRSLESVQAADLQHAALDGL